MAHEQENRGEQPRFDCQGEADALQGIPNLQATHVRIEKLHRPVFHLEKRGQLEISKGEKEREHQHDRGSRPRGAERKSEPLPW